MDQRARLIQVNQQSFSKETQIVIVKKNKVFINIIKTTPKYLFHGEK
jgi:hypothetical protein